VQRHFARDARQCFHQNVRRTHARFHGAEGMFDRFASAPHSVRIGVEALLYGFENMLVLPSGNTALWAGGAFLLEAAVGAIAAPVANLTCAESTCRLIIRILGRQQV
jgi:hypothetical protein